MVCLVHLDGGADCSVWLRTLFEYVRRKGAAPLSGSEDQTARAISAYAQYFAYFLCKWGV